MSVIVQQQFTPERKLFLAGSQNGLDGKEWRKLIEFRELVDCESVDRVISIASEGKLGETTKRAGFHERKLRCASLQLSIFLLTSKLLELIIIFYTLTIVVR
jgi:hypothetical protein